MSSLDSPKWKDFEKHHYNCAQCRKAALGRFSGVDMRVMFSRRCEPGKRLAKIFDDSLPVEERANWKYEIGTEENPNGHDT